MKFVMEPVIVRYDDANGVEVEEVLPLILALDRACGIPYPRADGKFLTFKCSEDGKWYHIGRVALEEMGVLEDGGKSPKWSAQFWELRRELEL